MTDVSESRELIIRLRTALQSRQPIPEPVAVWALTALSESREVLQIRDQIILDILDAMPAGSANSKVRRLQALVQRRDKSVRELTALKTPLPGERQLLRIANQSKKSAS
jgi:hypothetical protein